MKINNHSLQLFVLLGLLFCLCLAQQIKIQQEGEQLYTIEKAQQCFHSQALPQCQQKIQKCLMKPQCQKELSLYQDCTFQKQFPDQIFNGNCFKNWKKTSTHTKQVIDCIDSVCNLAGYNSQVSLSILYSCSTQALFDFNTECDQKCQDALKKIISQKVPYQPIGEIYQHNPQIKSQLNNQNAERIVEIIRKECIDENGAIRVRHQSDQLQKKLKKSKMYTHLNDQLATKQPAQGQTTFSDSNQPKTQQL